MFVVHRVATFRVLQGAFACDVLADVRSICQVARELQAKWIGEYFRAHPRGPCIGFCVVVSLELGGHIVGIWH